MRQKLKMAWQWHRCSADKQSLQLLWNARTFDNRTIGKFPCSIYPTCSPCSFLRTCSVVHRVQTLCSMPDNVKENSSATASSWDEHTKPLRKKELMALLADPPGAKLAQELSEVNQQNQFLEQQLKQRLGEVNQHNQIIKRQLHEAEDVLINFIRLLAFQEDAMETILQRSKIYISPRRKKGVPYIHPRLLSSLAVIAEKLKKLREAIVGETQLREVTITWYGLAKHVSVMGSFNDWSDEAEVLSEELLSEEDVDSSAEAEELLPEEDADSSDEEEDDIKYSTTLMLRPGRYEIIFMVDNVFKLSQELPVVGEGEALKNLLVVE